MPADWTALVSCTADCTHMHALQEESNNTATTMCLLASQKYQMNAVSWSLPHAGELKQELFPGSGDQNYFAIFALYL